MSIVGMLGGLGAWNWLILAVVLFALESIVPGVHFVWFGVAAIVTGLAALGTGMAWPAQLVLFALASIATVFTVRRLARPDAARSDIPDLNTRGAQYIGRLVTVEEPIRGGRGKVRVGDTLWQAEGEDLPAGTRVRVTGTNGTLLRVAREAP